MSLGTADREARARRRLIWGLVKWAGAPAGVGVVGLFGYQTGSQLNGRERPRLDGKVQALTAQVEGLQTDNANLKAGIRQAQAQTKQWEQRYGADMPSGTSKALLDLANRKLAEGVSLDRLTFLINAAGN